MFRRDPTYGPKHYDTRNQVLASTQYTEDHENTQCNANEVNFSYTDQQKQGKKKHQ